MNMDVRADAVGGWGPGGRGFAYEYGRAGLPVEATGIRVPVERDLRRHGLVLGLWPAGRGAQEQHQARMVARLRAERARTWSGIDASILMHPTVWKASGHLDHFTDPMVDCRECKHRFRADHVDALPWVHYLPRHQGQQVHDPGRGGRAAIADSDGPCVPECGKGELTAPRQFNLMFKTFMGPVEEDAAVTYLRPETAQAMFVNFDNVLQSMRLKLPFGIAQAGRSFRNEITPGNFIFRTREFEQMEIEYFVNPNDRVDGRPADEYWHDRWIEDCMAWFRRYGLSRRQSPAPRARA